MSLAGNGLLPIFFPGLQDKIWEWPGDEAKGWFETQVLGSSEENGTRRGEKTSCFHCLVLCSVMYLTMANVLHTTLHLFH